MTNKRKNSILSGVQDKCEMCNRELTSNTMHLFNGRHEQLLIEIDEAKEELKVYIEQLRQLGKAQDEDQSATQIFELLQEALDEAEKNGDAALFTDNKKNVWSIAKCNSLNIDANELAEKDLLINTKKKEIMNSAEIKSKSKEVKGK